MFWLALLLFPGLCLGRTLSVPDSFVTIQAAFDSTQDGDTVLVALGTYAEALHAPDFGCVLKGDVIFDPREYPRPVVDVSSLPGCDTLFSIRVTAHTVLTVSDFYFHNGPEVFEGEQIPDRHGVEGNPISLTFLRCIFDSVGGAIFTERQGATVTVRDCRFLHCPHNIIWVPTGNVQASACYFSGNSHIALV
jgi:hypothetical protein